MVLVWMVDIKILKKYDLNGFDINGKYEDTNNKYDPNGFDIYYTHKDTDDIYDLNGFDINGRIKTLKINMILMGLI